MQHQQRDDFGDTKVGIYGAAKYGLPGAASRYLLDWLVPYVSWKRVGITLGCFLLFVILTGVGGRLFLLAAVAGGMALWRKGRLDEAALVFGKDSEGYAEFAKIDSLHEHSRRQLRHDVLLSGFQPEQDRGSDGNGDAPPRFGRKGL